MTTTTTTTLTDAQITARIRELMATPRALVGSDTGTHGQPDQHSIYEEIDGARYAVYSFAGANGSRCTVEQAEADTRGRIRWFAGEQDRMAELRAELRALRQEQYRRQGAAALRR